MLNLSVIEGRLVEDPRITKNSDGSKGIMIKLFHDTGRIDKAGKVIGCTINVKAFIKAGVDATSPYEMCHEGDLIAIQGENRCDKPYMRDGVKIYPPQYILAQKIEFRESKAVTDARLAKKRAKAEEDPVIEDDERPF